ncbi:MAG: prolyl oligopeptidase family serine peptidase, partial [Propionibacteriaceae bacterium]|nr:prolyl oligopeptidase family serine peptidase [Propionibacteriaceae bacterium]
MQPAHLDRLVTLSVPSLHPAGWAVVGATRPDFTSDSYTGQLWRVPLKGGEPRRITRGFRDTAPKVSPDGRVIAFLRATGPAERPQLAIVDAQGGEPHVVTDQKLGVLDFAFTPDSTRLVFVAAVPEEGRHGTLDGVDAKAEDPRRFSTLQFQLNGRGWTPDQRRHVFLLDLPDPADEPVFAPVGRAAQGSDKPKLVPEARQLTEGDFDHAEPAATNEAVVVAAARHDDRDANLRQDLYLVPFDGGEPRLLTRTAATWLEAKAPVIADGQVYFLAADIGPDGRDFVARNNAVYRVGLAGGEPVRLTDPAATDFHGLFGPAPGGEGVVGVVFDGGQGKPHLVTPDGLATPLPLPDNASAEALATAPGQPVVATVATQQSPGELAVLDASPHVVTAFGRALAEAGPAVVPQPFTATSPDGAQVHGWVFLPDGPGPHPVLLNIHGGPYYAFGPAFFDEAQVYAAAGYAVVQANPRGSAGYGEDWGQAIVGDFGNLDSVDVLS